MERVKKKRVRYRSPERQLQQALNQSEHLTEGNSSISQRRLMAQRLKTLTILTARKRNDALKKAIAEIERLTAEVARLTAELAARPAPVIPVAFRPKAIDNDVSAILAQVAEEEKQ